MPRIGQVWYAWVIAMRRLARLLVALVVLTGCEGDTSRETDTPTSSSEQTTSGDRESDEHATTGTDRNEGVTEVDVVDGDTIDVELPDGPERVRLVGINAPEQGECLAREATQRLQDLLAGRREIELVADRSDRDDYGRLLRYVEADGVDVGAELVRAGLVLARRYPPDTARADVYDSLEQEATDAGAGMWAPDACGPAGTDVDITITEIRFDADGDDNQNLNDEWVRITNGGASEVDLTGWVLKDTSATHRYSFPTRFVLGGGASVIVRTGCGTDTETDLHWCNEGSAVWNNSGDTAFLLDPAGNIVSAAG